MNSTVVSGLSLGPVALGGALFGGLYGAMSAGQVAEVVDAAWAAGVRYFDTAPRYGQGVSEELLGQALRDRPREEFVLSTKVGWTLSSTGSERAFGADGIRASLEASLERLGLDRVDIAYLHDPDEYREEALAHAYPAMARLRSEGVVRAIGLGVNWPELPSWFVRQADLDLVLLAGRYTLLDRSAETELLPLCLERGVRVVAGAVFNSGILADPEANGRFDYLPAAPEILRKARALQAVCRDFGCQLPAAAMGFPLRHPAVVAVLVGAGTAEEIRADVTLAGAPLPDELWAALAQVW